MSLKSLQLDQLTLAYAAEDLKLSVSSIADLRLPTRLASLSNGDIVEALTSGSIWATRGRSCRLELQLFFHGKPLEVPNRLQIVESVGYHLRDAHVSEPVNHEALTNSQALVPTLPLNLSQYPSART